MTFPHKKLLLLMPDARIHRLDLSFLKISFREAPLTLTTLAALVPDSLNFSITLIDESIESVPLYEHFDLVAISCLTGTATRAYELATHFRKRHIPVVLGGVHVTLCPKEAKTFADTIMTGFSESTFPQMLHDFSVNQLKKHYEAENSPNLKNLPAPRRDLQKRLGYMMPNTVFATRGCKGSCDFCSVPAAKYGWQTRPIPDVIKEIKGFKGRRFTFNDVSLIEDREYAISLFKALIPLKKQWGGLATIRIADDPVLLDLMQQSGCIYLLIGFESVTDESLTGIRKGFNRVKNYKRVVETLHDYGIIVQGCFIFGLDHDFPTVFDKTVETVTMLGIDIPRYAIYTPYPKTPAYQKMEDQGRLRHKNWQHYDTQHVVFTPLNMTCEALDQGFISAYEKTFTLQSILHRTRNSPHPLVTFMGNTAYGLYTRRLKRETSRILDRTEKKRQSP